MGAQSETDTTVEVTESRLRQLEQRVDELEAENEQLREALDQKVQRTAVNHLLAALTGAEIDDYLADPMQHRHYAAEFHGRFDDIVATVRQHEDTVAKLDDGDVGKGSGAWVAIVEEAKRLQGKADHDLPGDLVQLYCEDIARATGRTERMASNYIEEYGEAKRGASWRAHEPATAANNNAMKRKALSVDLSVWGDDDDD